jgi:hypothetical protein
MASRQGFEIVPGRNGRLIATGGAVDATTRTVPVLFEFPLPDERLRIGMAAKAQVFAGAAREVVAVPASAVIDESGMSPTVFVMIGGESFERRRCGSAPATATGSRSSTDWKPGAAGGVARRLSGQARRHQDR